VSVRARRPQPLYPRLMCIVAVLLPSAATVVSADALKCYERRLPNGVNMVVCPDLSLTLSCVDVWVRAGSSFEAPDEIGAAHFLEHVIFKGTATHEAGQMDLRIENVGASLNASTSRDWAHFHTTVATPYLDTAIDILADALQNPLFDPAEVARERRVVPAQILDDAMGPLLCGEHPYGRPVYGTVDNVESLTAETIRKFFRRNYTGQAMTVVVVGNVEAENAFRRIAAGLDRKSVV